MEELKRLCEELGESYDDHDKLMKRAKMMYAVYDAKQKAVKVSMNSAYGDLGNSLSQTPCYNAAKVTTYMGRHEITRSARYLEKYHGCKLIYGDTDSVMVKIGEYDQNPNLDFKKLAIEIEKDINDKLFVPPMVLEYENLYHIFFSFKKKNYTVIKIDPKRPHLTNPEYFSAKGVPCVKRDRYMYVRDCYERMAKLIMVTYGSLQMNQETFDEEVKLLNDIKFKDVDLVIEAWNKKNNTTIDNIEFDLKNIGEQVEEQLYQYDGSNHYQFILQKLGNPQTFKFTDYPIFNGQYYRYHVFLDVEHVYQFDFYSNGQVSFACFKYKQSILKDLFYRIRKEMEQKLLDGKVPLNKLLKTINIKSPQDYKNQEYTIAMFYKRMKEDGREPIEIGDRLQVLVCKSDSKYMYDKYETLKMKNFDDKEIDNEYYVENLRKAFAMMEQLL